MPGSSYLHWKLCTKPAFSSQNQGWKKSKNGLACACQAGIGSPKNSRISPTFELLNRKHWNAPASFWRHSSVCCQYVPSVSGACRQCVSCFLLKKGAISNCHTSTYKRTNDFLSRRSWVRAPTLSLHNPCVCKSLQFNSTPHKSNITPKIPPSVILA